MRDFVLIDTAVLGGGSYIDHLVKCGVGVLARVLAEVPDARTAVD